MKTPTTPELPLRISPKAQKKIEEYAALLNLSPEHGFRIGVKKEGAHLKKIVGFDKKRFTDQQYSVENLVVFIDRRETKHVEKHVLDFKETSTEKGFVFRAKPQQTAAS